MNKRTVLLIIFFILVLIILLLVLGMLINRNATPEPKVPEVVEKVIKELPEKETEPVVEIIEQILEEVYETPTDIVEVVLQIIETTETDVVEEFTTPTEIVEDVSTPTEIVIEEPVIEEPVVEVIPEPEPEPYIPPVEEPPQKIESKFEFYASVSPYALQFVDYKDYKDRNSESGYGIEFGGTYRFINEFNNRFSSGLSLSYERYFFPSINNHCYNDFKAKLTSKLKALNIKDSFEASLVLDAGADFVLRDDADFGTYPLVGLGLEMKMKITEKLSAFIDTHCQMTIQTGSVRSVVYHLVPHAGFSFKGTGNGI